MALEPVVRMNSVVLEPASSAVAPLRVRDFDSADASRWDSYVAEHPEATFFHRAGWKRVIENAFGQRHHYMVAERDGRLVGVLPLFHQHSLLFGNALISAPFCVYAGALADDQETAGALVDTAMKRAAELGADYLELRNRQRQHPDWPTKDLYVTFRKSISGDDAQNLAAIPRKQRAMIRKGQKLLNHRVTRDIDAFYRMYASSVRNLGTPVFPKRYFRLLLEEFGEDAELLLVQEGETPVSAVLSFYHRNEVLPYYGGGTMRARAVKANDYMYWEVMRRAAARGVRLFDYGRSKRGTGSYRFKKHWGFEPEPLNYEFGLVGADSVPDISPANPKYRLFIGAWKKLPLPVANAIGPWLARRLG